MVDGGGCAISHGINGNRMSISRVISFPCGSFIRVRAGLATSRRPQREHSCALPLPAPPHPGRAEGRDYSPRRPPFWLGSTVADNDLVDRGQGDFMRTPSFWSLRRSQTGMAASVLRISRPSAAIDAPRRPRHHRCSHPAHQPTDLFPPAANHETLRPRHRLWHELLPLAFD